MRKTFHQRLIIIDSLVIKNVTLIYWLFFLGSANLFSQQSDSAKHIGFYFGQEPPGSSPEIFAPGTVSIKGNDEWGLAVNADWTEINFSRAENDKASIYHIKRISDYWSAQEIASFSGKFNDSHPVFSHDGNILFFCSKRPCQGAKEDMNLWYIKKSGNTWSSPENLGSPLIDQTVHAASIAASGNIYASGLVVFEKRDSVYLPARKLIPNILGRHPAVAPDESFIVFSSRMQDGYGGTDLYVTFKKSDNTWSTPQNLGKEINTEHVESSPTLSLEGKYIFFSRKGDIWWVSSQVIENIKAY